MDYHALSKDQLIRELEVLHQQIEELESRPSTDAGNEITKKIILLLDNINEPVWSVDRHYNIQTQNSAFKKLIHDAYGLELEPGDNFIRYTPVESQPLWSGFIERALRGENFSAEYEVNIDGVPQYYEFTFNPMESADGSIYSIAILGRDTTDRKINEMRIRESEKRFRSLVQNSNDIVFVVTEEGIIRYISPSVERVLGYSSADITNTDIFIYLHPEDSEDLQDHFKELMKDNRQNISFRCRFRRSDSSFAHIEGISSNLLKDEYIRGIVINARDVTERLGIEEALLESERRFRSVIEDLPAMICRFLPDGTLTFVNGNYCHAFKKTAGELLGKSFLNFIPEPDREKVKNNYLSLDRAKPVTTYQHRVSAPDGTIRWQRWTDRAIFNSNGEVVEYQSIGEDITEQKKNEQQIRLHSIALQTAANAIMITDKEGIVIWINPAFTKLTGFTSEDIVGRSPRLLKSGKHEEKFYKNLWDTIIAGKVWNGEMINKRKDGTLYTDRTTITPVVNEENETTNFIAIKEYM
jgi:PAS domain S-box-containing protein